MSTLVVVGVLERKAVAVEHALLGLIDDALDERHKRIEPMDHGAQGKKIEGATWEDS